MNKNPTYEQLKQQNIELQQKVSELTSKKEMLESLIDMLPQIIVDVDLEGKVTYANQKAFELTGYSKEDVESIINISHFVVPEDRPRMFQNIKKVLAGEKLRSNEYTALRKDGTTFPIMVYSSFKLINGQTNGMRTIVIDITKTKNMENALKAERDMLQRNLAEIKTLRGIIPICSYCKQIRDDQGFWNQVEMYVREHTEAEFSHGICPECAKKYYPEFKFDDD